MFLLEGPVRNPCSGIYQMQLKRRNFNFVHIWLLSWLCSHCLTCGIFCCRVTSPQCALSKLVCGVFAETGSDIQKIDITSCLLHVLGRKRFTFLLWRSFGIWGFHIFQVKYMKSLSPFQDTLHNKDKLMLIWKCSWNKATSTSDLSGW